LNAAGAIIQRAKFSRVTLIGFFETAPSALVGMEACSGAQWLARRLAAMGDDACIIPARCVKPYVKSNKADTVDAAAIAEAVTRPTICFVEVRAPEQVDHPRLSRLALILAKVMKQESNVSQKQLLLSCVNVELGFELHQMLVL
jgi:transposase